MPQYYTQYQERECHCFLSVLNEGEVSGRALVDYAEGLDSAHVSAETNLVGRGSSQLIQLHENRAILIRAYLRGGVVRHFTRALFFAGVKGVEKTRPVMELINSVRLFQAGVAVPRVLGAVVSPICGGIFYRGYICYQAVPQARNLLLLAPSLSLENLQLFAFEVGKEANLMLGQGVMHLDLHLGNVLVDQNDKVFLIDFDKSFCFQPSHKSKYALMLLSRWERSIKKHKLPIEVVDSFRNGLFGQEYGTK